MDVKIAEKIESFFTQFHDLSYKKGEIIIRADENPAGIYYLKDGYVKEYAISQKGDEIVINIFRPVSFFPMSWALNETPNEYFFEAMTDVDAWRAPREAVITFIKENPDVLYDLLRRVYKGTDGILTRMTYLMFGNAYARLITELLIYAKRFSDVKNLVDVQISEKELAAQSGMTRETVSREIKVLKDAGIIQFQKNKLIINDVLKLEAELAGGI